MKSVIVTLVVAGAFSVASAATYEWTDKAGVVHFTDAPEKVPVEYRSTAVRRDNVEEERVSTVPDENSSEQAVPDRLGQGAVLYGNHDESWWRNRHAMLDGELARLRDGLPVKKDELAKLRRRWVISMGRTPTDNPDAPESYSTQSSLSTPGRHRTAYYEKKAEIERDEARIAELESELQRLKDEANRFGVPVPWRR